MKSFSPMCHSSSATRRLILERLEDRLVPSWAVTDFTLPPPDSFLGAIAAGPDGNLWYSRVAFGIGGAAKIGRLSANGALAEFNAPTGIRSITTGPDGNLWLTLPPTFFQ